jgi:hypothetical protein
MFINPEITFAAIGALGGVTLTLLIQSLNSLMQRRLDRSLKTYETRLEIFTEFWFTVDEISRLSEWVEAAESDPGLQAFFRHRETVEHANAVTVRIESELQSDPPPSAEVAAQIRQQAREEAARLREAQIAIAGVERRIKRMHEELPTKVDEMAELQRDLRRLGFKLEIICGDDAVATSLGKMLARIRAGERITPNDSREFHKIAKRQIGISLR